MQSTHALIFGGKIMAGYWRGKVVYKYNVFSFSCLFCFIFSLVNYNEHAVKGKKKHLVPCVGKGFLVIM